MSRHEDTARPTCFFEEKHGFVGRLCHGLFDENMLPMSERGQCKLVSAGGGVAITTAPTCGRAAARSLNARVFGKDATTASRLLWSVSITATWRISGNELSARTRFAPQFPRPTTATTAPCCIAAPSSTPGIPRESCRPSPGAPACAIFCTPNRLQLSYGEIWAGGIAWEKPPGLQILYVRTAIRPHSGPAGLPRA